MLSAKSWEGKEAIFTVCCSWGRRGRSGTCTYSTEWLSLLERRWDQSYTWVPLERGYSGFFTLLAKFDSWSLNRTLSAIKRCPSAVVLNLIDAMHMTSLFICIASVLQRLDTVLLLIMYGSRFTNQIFQETWKLLYPPLPDSVFLRIIVR